MTSGECVDCLINNIKILFKINKSSIEVYSIIYNMYYKKANIPNYTFPDWKYDFQDFIDCIYIYIKNIKEIN